MKFKHYLLITNMFCLLFFFSCRNGANQNKANETITEVNQVQQLEQSSEELQETSSAIEQKEAALEAALKDLEDIDN